MAEHSPDPREASEQGWLKVFEGDVWRAHIVGAELEGRGVPVLVTEPQFFTPNPELNGMPLGAAEVFVPLERRAEALRIVRRDDGRGATPD